MSCKSCKGSNSVAQLTTSSCVRCNQTTFGAVQTFGQGANQQKKVPGPDLCLNQVFVNGFNTPQCPCPQSNSWNSGK